MAMDDPNNADAMPASSTATMPSKAQVMAQAQDASKDMFQPFVAGFFQGFFEVAKKYYREKREARKAQAERAEDTTPAIPPAELQEGGVWIGPAVTEQA